MAKYLDPLVEIIPPTRDLIVSRRQDLERKDSEFARTSSTLEKIQLRQHVLSSEMRGSVSSSRNDYYESDRLESFADRLILDNVRKQAKPDIVARHVQRSTRLLADLPRATIAPKRFETAWVSTSRRVNVNPRTVFGTDAWTRTGHATRNKFITKVLALPCVERSVRREVLFAKGKGGRGYRVPHRMSKFADIWC